MCVCVCEREGGVLVGMYINSYKINKLTLQWNISKHTYTQRLFLDMLKTKRIRQEYSISDIFLNVYQFTFLPSVKIMNYELIAKIPNTDLWENYFYHQSSIFDVWFYSVSLISKMGIMTSSLPPQKNKNKKKTQKKPKHKHNNNNKQVIRIRDNLNISNHYLVLVKNPCYPIEVSVEIYKKK